MDTNPTVALCQAIESGDTLRIRTLLNNQAGLENAVVAEGGVTGIRYAAEKGNREAIEAFLAASVDLNQASGGRVPLHDAVVHAPVPIIKFLLARGADPNSTTSDGETPIFLAARSRHLLDEADEQVVPHLLLEFNAFLDVHSAAALGRFEDVNSILRANPGAIEDSPRPLDILMNGTVLRSSKLCSLLLDYGANPNGEIQSLQSPLKMLLSIVPCDEEVLQSLLIHGAKPTIRTDDGILTASMYAKLMNQSSSTVHILESSEL